MRGKMNICTSRPEEEPTSPEYSGRGGQEMSDYKFLIIAVLVSATLFFGASQGLAETVTGAKPHNYLKDRQNSAAALRKSQGMMEYTTGDDRLAAAQRNAARITSANAKGKGVKK